MATAKLITQSHLAPSAYIYQILPLSARTFAAVSSDDTLTIFQNTRTEINVVSRRPDIHRGLTCAETMGTSIITAGRDGTIQGFSDPSQAKPDFVLQVPSGKGVSALVVDPERRLIAAGTEHTEEGVGEVQVYVWLLNESTSQPARSYVDSHTDTITQLLLDPRNRNRLISASTDGLINVFDLSIVDEDDAVEQAINNKSAISHLSLDEADDSVRILTCVSHDEKATFYELKDEAEESEEAPEAWNLKDALSCDYAVKLANVSSWQAKVALVVGCNKEETGKLRVDLCSLTLGRELIKGKNTAEATQVVVTLDGAHGDEVIRDLWFDADGSLFLTAAEDGWIKMWGGDCASMAAEESERTPKKKEKKSRKKEANLTSRFAPY